MAHQPSSLLNRKLSRTHRCRAMYLYEMKFLFGELLERTFTTFLPIPSSKFNKIIYNWKIWIYSTKNLNIFAVTFMAWNSIFLVWLDFKNFAILMHNKIFEIFELRCILKLVLLILLNSHRTKRPQLYF